MLNKNKNFRSISPNEYIEEGTLVWIERNDHCNDVHILGPFIMTNSWNTGNFDNSGVNLLCPTTGEEEIASYRSFLYSTYYIIKEENYV